VDSRVHDRILVEHDTSNLAEDKSRFVYTSFGDRSSADRLGRRQDLPLRSRFRGYQKQFRALSLSHEAAYPSPAPPPPSPLPPLSLSLSLSLSRCFLLNRRADSSCLSPRPACRRLLHRAFALEVISKNFWRWIVPRDGNRGLTLPAAFTQTTYEETTFASVRATTVRLTINERNNSSSGSARVERDARFLDTEDFIRRR